MANQKQQFESTKELMDSALWQELLLIKAKREIKETDFVLQRVEEAADDFFSHFEGEGDFLSDFE